MTEQAKINGMSKSTFIRKVKIDDARSMYLTAGGSEGDLKGMNKTDIFEEMVALKLDAEKAGPVENEVETAADTKAEAEKVEAAKAAEKKASDETKAAETAKLKATAKAKEKKAAKEAAKAEKAAAKAAKAAKKPSKKKKKQTGEEAGVFGDMDSTKVVLEEGILYKVDSHCWWGKSSRVPKEMLGNAPKRILKGVQTLIDDTHIAPLNSYRQKGERVVIKNGFPFTGFRGVYFVPKALIEKTEKGLTNCQRDFNEMRSEFMSNFKVYKKEWAQTCKENNVPIPPDEWYPSEYEIKNKFKFEWNVFSFQLPNPKLGILTEDQYKTQVENHRKKMDQFLSSVLTTLALKFEDIVVKLNKRLEDGETIKPKTLSSLKSFVETFDSMNITKNEELSNLVARVGKIVGTKSAKDINESEKVRDRLKTKIGKLVGTVGSLIDNDTKFKRSLDF
jgi:hypothetical protein